MDEKFLKILDKFGEKYPNISTHVFRAEKISEEGVIFLCERCDYYIITRILGTDTHTHKNRLLFKDNSFPTCEEQIMEEALK